MIGSVASLSQGEESKYGPSASHSTRTCPHLACTHACTHNRSLAMGVLAPTLSPKSPTANGKRTSPLAVAIIGAVVAVLLCCVYMMAPGGAMGPPNRLRVRLNLDTGSGKASWEAEGDEQQVADAVAALGAAALDRKKPDVPGEAEVAAVAAALEATLDDKSEEQPEAQPKEQQQGQQLEEADEEEAEEAAAFDSDGEQASAAEAEGQQGEKEGEQQEADEEGTEEEDAEAVGRKFTEKVGACDNKGQFGCLTRQADMALGQSGGKRQFRFPHFYIVGFQKCATTSLFHHLGDHPQIEPPSNKEPEFYTKACSYNAMRCISSQQREYMREILMFRQVRGANFTKAAFEGSTHYALEGRWLAMQLMEIYPWLKIVMTMREPISQAIAMLNHQLDHKRYPDCYDRDHNLVFECIHIDLDFESRYTRSLNPWLKHVPRQQLHLLQYENLTSAHNMKGALRDIKRFLEVEPTLPSDELGMKNFRHQRKNGNGWPMQRQQYEALVEKARRNSEEVVDLVRQNGFADADAWRANWEAAWKLNLEQHCEPGPEGLCMVQVT